MNDAFEYHGGRLNEAAAHFGGDPSTWLDLSTGLNPTPWPVHNVPAPEWTTLPAPAALTKLEQIAAGHFGADPDFVCAIPGSEFGLRLLASEISQRGCSLTPAYRTHSEAFLNSRPIAFGGSVEDGETVVVANPNNPDGKVYSADEIMNWSRGIGAANGWLIVDEAFADCHSQISVASHVGPGRRLIVLRSFGKFFGLAGLRLGFLIAPPAIVSGIRGKLGAWPLHAAALTIGSAAYADQDWIDRTRVELPARADHLDAVLNAHGLEAQGECPLFRYVEVRDARNLFEHLARARILGRPFTANSSALRLGVPDDPAALERLNRALDEWKRRG